MKRHLTIYLYIINKYFIAYTDGLNSVKKNFNLYTKSNKTMKKKPEINN